MAPDHPKQNVSCIMPIYNSEKFLKLAFNSVKDQVDEVIFVDDKSPDNSIIILKKLKKKYRTKIKILQLPENKGVGNAKNKGAKLASYDLLLFLDSDVSLEKDWVKKAKSALTNKIACAGGKFINPNKTISQQFMDLATKFNFREFPKTVDGAYLIKKDVFFECGMLKIICRTAGGASNLFQAYRNKGYKIRLLDIKANHLGEPEKLRDIISRQWIYGSRRFFLEGKKYKLLKIGYMLFLLTPFSICISLLYYYYLFTHNERNLRNLKFLLSIPIIIYLYTFVYAVAYLSSVLGFNRKKYEL